LAPQKLQLCTNRCASPGVEREPLLPVARQRPRAQQEWEPDSNQQFEHVRYPAQRAAAAALPGDVVDRGRCQSTSGWPRSARAATLPITSIARHASHRHTGAAAPQKRWRDTAQSRAFASQSANRLSPTCPGTQWILRLFATAR
jgi:hypothetical protein